MSKALKLIVLSTALSSASAFAVNCQSNMVTRGGSLAQEFIGSGRTEQAACRAALRSCNQTLNNLERQVARTLSCETVGVVSDRTVARPGRGQTTTPTPSPTPTRPRQTIPTPSRYSELDILANTLEHGGTSARKMAAQELADFDTPDALVLAIETLSDSDYYVRVAASNSKTSILNKMDMSYYSLEVLDLLGPMLDASSSNIRKAAAEILGTTGEQMAIMELLPHSADSDYYVRVAISNSLNTLMQLPQMKKLVRENINELENLGMKSSTTVRKKVAVLLATAAVPRTIDLAVEMTGDSDYYVRVEASSAMTEIMQANNYPNLGMNKINQLERIFHSSGSTVRKNVIKALAATHNPIVKPLLYEALDDSDYYVRVAAKEALNSL